MKFSIRRKDLQRLIKATGPENPREGDTLDLYGCGRRVFVESSGNAAGIEAIVLADGMVRLPAKKFCDILKTYKGTRFLNFEADREGLVIQNFFMPVLVFDASPEPRPQALTVRGQPGD